MVDELKTVGGDGRDGSEEARKVMFLPEQQAKVQELIDEAYRKAYSKAQKGKGGSEEVERLKGEVERLQDERKSAALLRAISRHNVVDAEEVVELVKHRVRMEEDGSVKVLGDSGAVRINTAGQPMTLDEFVSDWLGERPHHLRPFGGSGAGSQGARFGAGSIRHNLSDPASWRAMPREELDRLLREGLSVQGSAGQTYRFRDVKNPFIEARRRKFNSAAV
ncbi:MAG: hypothetical protein H3C68_08190 [Deltaproteobacteria bacterium]|nr:hypothetical protein [Deltaproteobacteria bacterium]MBZ0219347.1 hypothetical protein [Deltaproteobacteria bacterium]